VLFLYAVVSKLAAGELGSGVSGEALDAIEVGDLIVVAGEVERAPVASPEQALAFDRVIKRLLAGSEALLPMRFGSTVRDRAALATELERAREPLANAIELVRGRVQMTLRLTGARTSSPAPAESPPATGSEYLARKLEEHRRAKAVPELDPIRPAFEHLIVAEQTERHDSGPWLASVYHLIDRDQVDTYKATLKKQKLEAQLSGPWAPYAFAPGLFE
jgi:hypothetical protein